MLNLNGITNRLFPSTLPTYGPGVQVEVETLCYGKQTGTIQLITDSPYYGEAGVQRAFVVGEGWTDYILVDELVLADPDFTLEDDPEYLQFLYDTEAAEMALEFAD